MLDGHQQHYNRRFKLQLPMDSVIRQRGIVASRSQRPCQGCQGRKIACDRTLPACSTCKKRGKSCPGYSPSLSWPRIGDRRRAQTANVQSRNQSGCLGFLNTFSWDVDLSRSYLEELHYRAYCNGFDPSLAFTQSKPAGAELRPDICRVLCRMALLDNSPPSLAVRHSMDALCLTSSSRMKESINSHQQAVSALQITINYELDGQRRGQEIAASMLLSLYEHVATVGSREGCAVYFDGCLVLLASCHEKHRDYGGDAAIMLDWIFYYSVLYRFTIKHLCKRSAKQESILKRNAVISKAVFNPNRRIIQPSLGCSLELFDILNQAIDLLHDRGDPEFMSQEHQKAINKLQIRLDMVDQKLGDPVVHDQDHILRDREAQLAMARLFQLSICIYLDRVVRGSDIDSIRSRDAAEEAFKILKELEICTRPFPIFIISLQAKTDNDRILILNTIERTHQSGAVNQNMIEEMIRRIWTRQDLLNGITMDALTIVNDAINANGLPPTFT